MSLFLHGVAVCKGCGKTALAQATCSDHGSGIQLWWELPKGWLLFERGQMTTYCTYACFTAHSKSYGRPDRVFDKDLVTSPTFDTRAIHTLIELMQAGQAVSADDVLAAFEAVLIAYRKDKTP